MAQITAQAARCVPPALSGKPRYVEYPCVKWVACVRQRPVAANRSATIVQASVSTVVEPLSREKPVVVWYKHDLRVLDHPGISSALSSNRPVIGFYCFDLDVVSDQSTEIWALNGGVLRGAVACLKEQLRRLNCTLVVRQGDTAKELLKLIRETGAELLICESEVEYRWASVLSKVQEGLPSSVESKIWRAPLYEVSSYATNYQRFCRKRGRPLSTLPPVRPSETTWAPEDPDYIGEVPSSSSWQTAVEGAISNRFPAVPLEATPVSEPDPKLIEERGWVYPRIRNLVKGGEVAYLEMLKSYVSRKPAQADSGLKPQTVDMLQLADELESIPGNQSGSFTAIFKPALALGMLSSRQIYETAMSNAKAQTGFQVPKFFWSTEAKAAADCADCADYHISLAHLMKARPAEAKGTKRMFWRWHGQMVDFLVAEPEGGVTEDTPAVLLVHGFGAFAEHWRRNIKPLADRGYVVYACTLPGFGPSEKAPQVYTLALWKSYVRDFVVNVIGKPAVVAGNSIGGVIQANACADHPHCFSGAVMVNTAGSTEANWDPSVTLVRKERPKLLVDILSWATFKYLQSGITKQLQRLYPTRPFNADEFLNKEIYRASCDPCSLQVLKSGFYLAPPRPLPHLLKTLYDGPVLVLQGIKDPLNDAAGRADALEEAIPKARKVCLDAGHCPHDEVPELVNHAIVQFCEHVVMKENTRVTV